MNRLISRDSLYEEAFLLGCLAVKLSAAPLRRRRRRLRRERERAGGAPRGLGFGVVASSLESAGQRLNRRRCCARWCAKAAAVGGSRECVRLLWLDRSASAGPLRCGILLDWPKRTLEIPLRAGGGKRGRLRSRENGRRGAPIGRLHRVLAGRIGARVLDTVLFSVLAWCGRRCGLASSCRSDGGGGTIRTTMTSLQKKIRISCAK